MLGFPHFPREPRGRRIALYPGAFRPPHAAHFLAVQHLLTLPDIDQVVIIISNRCRTIPGTTLALDATIAQRIWSIYLRGIENVRVEVASHTAVGQAFEYFDHAEIGDRLWFCLGESDISQGDDRFRNLNNLSTQSGIQASLIQAPTGSLAIRSTSLRAALIQGDSGRQEFMAALPSHLTDNEAQEVWKVCLCGKREIGEVIQEKVRAFIIRTGLGEIEDLRRAGQNTIDPVFRVRLKNSPAFFIKYAGDALGTEELGNVHMLKPRQRLSVERKALKWLRAHLSGDVEIPEVVYFEKKTWTLALSEVGQQGTSLLDQLQNGIFNRTIAARAAQFLAECHMISHSVPPLWGDAVADHQHWKKMLDQKTVELTSNEFPQDVRNHLRTLMLASEKASETIFMNLDFQPKNILIGKKHIGVIDFEISSSVGDPAYDLGSFLGHYVYWILVSSTDTSWQKAIQNALHTYQHVVGNLWERMNGRVAAFTGAMLLHILVCGGRSLNKDIAERVRQAGMILLAQGIPPEKEPDPILCETIPCYSREFISWILSIIMSPHSKTHQPISEW